MTNWKSVMAKGSRRGVDKLEKRGALMGGGYDSPFDIIPGTMHHSASSWPCARRDPLGATGSFVAPGTLLWCPTGLVDQPESSCAWVAACWRGWFFGGLGNLKQKAMGWQSFQFNFQDGGVTPILNEFFGGCLIFCQVIFAGVQPLW